MNFGFRSATRLIVVEARILGPSQEAAGDFIVDTGATWTLASREILLLAGYSLSATSEQTTIVTVSGRETVPRVAVRRIRALGRERRNLVLLCHNLPPELRVDGLLGLDFLRQFRVVIDFPKRTIALR
jgi:predicted aspartyl protease